MQYSKCRCCEQFTKNPFFCSKSCSAKFNNTKNPKRKRLARCCKICEIEFTPVNRESRCQDHRYTHIGKAPTHKITRGLCIYNGCDALKATNRKYCMVHKGGPPRTALVRTLGEILAKLKNQHPSWVMSYVRTRGRSTWKQLKKLPCESCGYNKHVEICHIRPIKNFPLTATIEEINDRANIRILCPNCHWEFDNPRS